MLFLSTGGLTRDSSGMFGTLDLGGGSTQITLNPVDPVNLYLITLRVHVNVKIFQNIYANPFPNPRLVLPGENSFLVLA